jgi:cytosine deaminase
MDDGVDAAADAIDAGVDDDAAAVRAVRGVALAERPGRFDIELRGALIADVRPAAESGDARWLALPAFVNFHAHADRAFAAPSQRPASFAEAVSAAKAARSTTTAGDIRRRARRLFARAVEHGTAAIRTHTDVDPVTGMRAIEGVLAAAADVGGALDVETVAFANAAADPAQPVVRALLAEAVGSGATVLGAVPALYANPAASAIALLDLAATLGVEVDFHLDEHLDPSLSLVERVIDAVRERRLDGRVTVSHGCALSTLEPGATSRILVKMAAARVVLSVQPALNLYLQDRGEATPRRRGLAPLVEAIRAGVAVRLGSDNVRDWFFPLGDADPLEECYLAMLGAHLERAEQLLSAACGGRAALAAGDRADLVLIPAQSFDDALARRPAGRVLVKAGRRVRAQAFD